MKLTDFFETDYVDYASYDNLRKIASVVDGQKNAGRKILYTILEKNVNSKIKVSQLGSKVAEFAEYLHGSLESVIVGQAQDYTGTNNIPLLQKKGNFGTRFSPEASAPRYIYTYGSDEFFKLFNKEDCQVLKQQFFEGNQIEPMFYVPTVPLLLINGAEGLSSGFAQKILPRNPDELKSQIELVLKGEKSNKTLTPWFRDFSGTIEQGNAESQWIIKGVVNRIGANKVHITEVPPGYSLKGYLKVLDDLEDKKIIQHYIDKSEDDSFDFTVTIPTKLLKTWDEDTLLNKLKLKKTITENYTVIDENNQIKVYESANELLEHYIRVKLEYLQLRKEYLLDKYTHDIEIDNSKLLFIKMIQNDELVISKRKKTEIVKDLNAIEKIITRDGSYDYLLNMSIVGLTQERMQRLEDEIKMKYNKLTTLQNQSPEDIWITEL